MIMPEDIHPEWTPEAIAMFAAMVGAVEQAMTHVVRTYNADKIDNASGIISHATLVGLKAVMVAASLRQFRSCVPGFKDYEQLLRLDLARLPEQMNTFENTLCYQGRA